MGTAHLVVFDYFHNPLLLVGYIVQNSLWGMLMGTKLAVLPFVTLVIREWYKATEEGDEAGNKGILTVNRIKSSFWAMVFCFSLTCQPTMTLSVVTASINRDESSECGTRRLDAEQWAGDTLNQLDGQSPGVPIWWAFVHVVSQGAVAHAVSAVPCTTDFQSIRVAVNAESISDPALQHEVQRFASECYATAVSIVRDNYGRIEDLPSSTVRYPDGTEIDVSGDIGWIGSRFFRATPSYYDELFARDAIRRFPYVEERDYGRHTPPSDGGYPTCKEWWEHPELGLRAALRNQISPSTMDRLRGWWSRNVGDGEMELAEDVTIRRMVALEHGAANNRRLETAGYADTLGSGSAWDALGGGLGTVGGAAGLLALESGMYVVKLTLPMIQGIMIMAISMVLPIIIVMSGYSYKTVGTATFTLFGIYFLTFWWELARWIDNRLWDLIYASDGANIGLLGRLGSVPDMIALQFVSATTYLFLPALWMGMLAWAGHRVGGGLGDITAGGAGKARQASEQTANKATQRLR
ncbi:conjugal transfer protein TraG N-terminal domain-containing protein [Billgrantia desiderata]|uniref:conjugal transfer protein TraG N-terminal domain-containing protein n=1 Tax=Billgrantia desiderata TaxID=52021 RepID=UPI001F2CEA20|nr:conjugal transfer protein TraG N-terminal domain-containing protein [Halomonas desiderata]MCE8013899.1 hypothetical protein [Halomonas desiderata]